ncbi:MAG: HAMP domain-containing protein [Anaerolineae bacterium]|nr:HAMP domain-containing protein [Anaerolineae bacterium]
MNTDGGHRPAHRAHDHPAAEREGVRGAASGHLHRGADRRRYLLLRFLFLFGGLVLLFVVALAVLWLLLNDVSLPLMPRDGYPMPMMLIMRRRMLFACLTPLVFTFVAFVIGRWFFEQVAPPIADLMDAADAVAEGDLAVRVPEEMGGEFGKLAQRFNRMIAELQRAERQRRNMTADIAHELRTPLHIIQGNLEGMLDGVYEPTAENIQTTLEETRLLARLVEDLQTLSLAEAGQLLLHRVQFLADDLLADVATSFAVQAEEQGVTLEVETAGAAQALLLFADPQRLDQALSNLVSNALRHTPRGGRITLHAEGLPGRVRLYVEDTGSGIPAEDLPYIFDRFWRGDRARTRSRLSGSGLGLAIARQLVAAHGGTIEAQSPSPASGVGARFTIDLPAAQG